jgi:hypothetical protein
VESQSALRAGNQRWPGLCHNPQDVKVFCVFFGKKKQGFLCFETGFVKMSQLIT